MTDILIHPITFGGRAFEPLTGAGRDWCAKVRADNDDNPSVYIPYDGCMAIFDDPAFGCEPYDFQAFFDDMQSAGLTAQFA
jgi:hypothetical protein